MRGPKHWMFLFILFGFGGIAGLCIAYQGLTYAQSGSVVANSQRAEQIEVLPRRIVELDNPEWRQNVPLQAIVGESRIIAIGVPLRNNCRQAPNGQITTDYQVQLQEVIKGKVQPDAVISVKMPGGLITENDGTLLEARARAVRKMQNGKKYILFLKNAPGGNDSLSPLRGSQGLYEIPRYGTRVIHLGRSFLLPPADDGEEISVFLQAVRSLVNNP